MQKGITVDTVIVGCAFSAFVCDKWIKTKQQILVSNNKNLLYSK